MPNVLRVMSRHPYCVPIASNNHNGNDDDGLVVGLPFASAAAGLGVKSLLHMCLQYVGTYFQEKNLSLACIAELNMEIKQQLLEVVCAKNKATAANLCIFLDTELRQLNLLEGRGLNEGEISFFSEPLIALSVHSH